MGKSQSRAVVNIKPLLHLIWDVGGEIDVKEWRFVGRLDPKAVGDLLFKLGKNVEATTEQCLVGFYPRKVLTIGNKHRQKHDPIRGQVVYLHVVVPEEISNEPVDGHPESAAKEVNEDHNLTGVGGGYVTPSVLHPKPTTKTCHEHHVYVIMHVIEYVDKFLVT